MNARPRPRRSPSRRLAPDQPVTVGEYLAEWLAGKQSLRPSTRQSYEIHIRKYLTPYLGGLALTELRPTQIEEMYRAIAIALAGDLRGQPLTPSSLRRIHATLSSALNTAVRRGLLERNPAATVELPPARAVPG